MMYCFNDHRKLMPSSCPFLPVYDGFKCQISINANVNQTSCQRFLRAVGEIRGFLPSLEIQIYITYRFTRYISLSAPLVLRGSPIRGAAQVACTTLANGAKLAIKEMTNWHPTLQSHVRLD